MVLLIFLIFPSYTRRLAEQAFPTRASKSYQHRIQIASLTSPSCVSLDKLLTFLIPNFPIYKMEIVIISNYLKKWFSGLSDILQIKHFAQ